LATHAGAVPVGIDNPQGLTRDASVFPAGPAVSATKLVRVNALAGLTVSVAAPELDEYTPPLQVNEYTALPTAVGVTLVEPLAGCAPLQAPLAVHAVPLLEDQVTVALWPAVTVVGLTAMVMAAADMPLLPPPP
jgi:hypothetical protein